MNLLVAKGVLGSYGIEVDTCLSGREAVARCSSVSYAHESADGCSAV